MTPPEPGPAAATSVHRPSPAHLAVDTIRSRAAAAIMMPDHGSLVEDLDDVLGQIASSITSPVGRAALIAGL